MPATLAPLLLALGGAAAPAQTFDCVAGLCIGQPFDLAAAGDDWQLEDWPDPTNAPRCPVATCLLASA